MPKNMRSYTLRQWLSHSENTTGETQNPVLHPSLEHNDDACGNIFTVIWNETVIRNVFYCVFDNQKND